MIEHAPNILINTTLAIITALRSTFSLFYVLVGLCVTLLGLFRLRHFFPHPSPLMKVQHCTGPPLI
jgi:hypothetical protein